LPATQARLGWGAWVFLKVPAATLAASGSLIPPLVSGHAAVRVAVPTGSGSGYLDRGDEAEIIVVPADNRTVIVPASTR
jgi:hypothetical protein